MIHGEEMIKLIWLLPVLLLTSCVTPPVREIRPTTYYHVDGYTLVVMDSVELNNYFNKNKLNLINGCCDVNTRTIYVIYDDNGLPRFETWGHESAHLVFPNDDDIIDKDSREDK